MPVEQGLSRKREERNSNDFAGNTGRSHRRFLQV
jgi:hypothetical protein